MFNTKTFFIVFLFLLLFIAGCQQGCTQMDNTSQEDAVKDRAASTERGVTPTRESSETTTPETPATPPEPAPKKIKYYE